MTQLRDGLSRKDLSKTDKYLLIVASHDGPVDSVTIRAIAKENGWKDGALSQPSAFLSKNAHAVLLPRGWTVTGPGRADLERRGVIAATGILTPVTEALEKLLLDLHDADKTRFVEEAIACVKNKSYRAAIVLTWVGAVFILYSHVVANKLTDFNAEMHRRWPRRFNDVKKIDDLTTMKESEFLAVSEGIGLFTKAEGKELVACLDRRNTAGHPNSHTFTEVAVGSHIETLISTVYKRF